VFPCALGTFSIKERERLLVLWCDSYNAAERERESISLCFGHDLVLKRVSPYTLGTFSVKESVSLYFGHV
jgi:hypothetical protein